MRTMMIGVGVIISIIIVAFVLYLVFRSSNNIEQQQMQQYPPMQQYQQIPQGRQMPRAQQYQQYR